RIGNDALKLSRRARRADPEDKLICADTRGANPKPAGSLAWGGWESHGGDARAAASGGRGGIDAIDKGGGHRVFVAEAYRHPISILKVHATGGRDGPTPPDAVRQPGDSEIAPGAAPRRGTSRQSRIRSHQCEHARADRGWNQK